MIERIDHNRRFGAEPDGAKQVLLQIRTDRKDRIEQQQQSPAAGEIFDKQIRLAGGKGGARADIGDDRAIRRDGAFGRRHDAAQLVADLGERNLQPVELLRRGLEHVAGAGLVVAAQSLDVAVVKMRLRRTERLAMAGDEAEGLDPLLERAHGRIGHARRVGRVLDQYLAATGLQYGGVVGAHADVACQPRLLVEIDGAEGEQRMAVRGDGDQLLRRPRVGIAGVVEIGHRQRRVQIGDYRRQLRRRRIAALAADVEMHVVPEQRDIGGDHDGDRGGSDERGGQPRRKTRAGAAQRQAAAPA